MAQFVFPKKRGNSIKVVINKCYGGFGISPLAAKEFAKAHGRKCYFFTFNHDLDCYVPVTMKQAEKELLWTAFDIPNPNDVFPSDKDWHTISDAEKQRRRALSDKHDIETGRSLDRSDPKLVEVVQKLGKKANGKFADLEIVTIPNGVEYTIEEYDGFEHIAEKHRTWS